MEILLSTPTSPRRANRLRRNVGVDRVSRSVRETIDSHHHWQKRQRPITTLTTGKKPNEIPHFQHAGGDV